MKIRVNTINIMFMILVLNPIMSLLFDNLQIYYHYITYPLIMILLLIIERKQEHLYKTSIIICAMIVICEVFAIYEDGHLGKLHNHLFNYIDATLLMIFMTNTKNIENFDFLIKRHLRLIKYIVITINIVELIMLISHKGYVDVYSWQGTFFRGTNSMPHTLSYLMLATMIFGIIYIIYTHKKWFLVMFLVPSYCIFASGARVSLILAILLIAILLSYVMTEKEKNLIIKAFKILPPVIILLFLLRNKILNSNLMAKITTRITSGNSTAGRIYIWSDLLKHYLYDSSIIQYFWGQGDDKTYYFNLNNIRVGVEVWAHNDFMQIIIGKGFIGFFMYIIALLNYIKTLIRRSGNIYTLAIIVFIIVAAVLNGFYSYRDINMCIPFLMIINEKLSYKRKKTNDYAKCRILYHPSGL